MNAETDASALVLILALVGGYFIVVGFLHFCLWLAWRLHFPMPRWVEKHLNDDWGQHG